jgi:hypothetical protein
VAAAIVARLPPWRHVQILEGLVVAVGAVTVGLALRELLA